MSKQSKTASELEAAILDGLRAESVDAASIEVYRLDEPGIAMDWTVRRLRLNKVSDIKVEGILKKVVFALVERYGLASSAVTASSTEQGS